MGDTGPPSNSKGRIFRERKLIGRNEARGREKIRAGGEVSIKSNQKRGLGGSV